MNLPVLLLGDFGTSVRCLGQGTYSTVCLYRDPDVKKLREHGVPILPEYAVKVSSEKGLTFDTVSEIAASRQVAAGGHDRFISLPLAIVHESLATETKYGLVYTPADEDLYRALRGNPSENEMFRWTRELSEGLYYIHQSNILHLDLKPSNVLVEQGQVRISDLGSAWTRACQHLPTGTYTTLFYRAPEILVQLPEYDEKADVWSLACTIAEIFLGEQLFPNMPDDFPGTSEEYMFRQMLELLGSPTPEEISVLSRGKEWEKFQSMVEKHPNQPRRVATLPLPPDILELLENMFRWDPADRWTMQEVCLYLGIDIDPPVDCASSLEIRAAPVTLLPEFYTPDIYRNLVIGVYKYLSKIEVPEAFFLTWYYLSRTPVTKITSQKTSNAAVFIALLASGYGYKQSTILGTTSGTGTSLRQILRAIEGDVAPVLAHDFLLLEEPDVDRRSYGLRLLVLFYYLRLQEVYSPVELYEMIYTRTGEQEIRFGELLPIVPVNIWELLQLDPLEVAPLLSGTY